MNIRDYFLSTDEYYHDLTTKDTIVLHYTAGSYNPYYIRDWWESDDVIDKKTGKKVPYRIGTAFGIGRQGFYKNIDCDGLILRFFDEKKWAHALGIHADNNTILNKKSVQIEICNWGRLTEKDGVFYHYRDGIIPTDQVYEFDEQFRSSKYYQKYTEKQLESLYSLLKYLMELFPKVPKYGLVGKSDLSIKDFELSTEALKGMPGVWSHTSYRLDKDDVSPQVELIELLKSI